MSGGAPSRRPDDPASVVAVTSVLAAAPVLAATLLTALAAQVAVPVPGSPVPQSLQTLAVVVAGGALGAGRGGLAMVVYVGLGAVGLPVFADGGSGVAALSGPGGGYLAGFVVAAAFVGWWVARPRGRGFPRVAAGMVAAHLVILTMGWGRLALLTGPGDALAQGVTPFLWGGFAKSLVAGGILVAWGRVRPGRGRLSPREPEAGGRR